MIEYKTNQKEEDQTQSAKNFTNHADTFAVECVDNNPDTADVGENKKVDDG